jgi:hypothetical protein
MKPLFEFLTIPKNNKKHWINNFGWTMVGFMHQKVMRATRAILGLFDMWLLVVMKLL